MGALGRGLWFAACAVLTSGCHACPRVKEEATSAEPRLDGTRTLVFGTVHEPDTLDPAFVEISGAQEIVRLLFRDLTVFDDKWQVRPQLAMDLPVIETSTMVSNTVSILTSTTTSASLSAATSTAPLHSQWVRWNLRPGFRWSDGQPVTADDVVFGHAVESNPDLLSISHHVASQVLRIVPHSPLEFVVQWKTPYAGFDGPRVHAILPKHAYPNSARTPKPFRGMGRAPVSNGPYRLKSWLPGRHLLLERNPFWPGDRPAIETLVWRFFPSEDAFLAELETGGIDALGEASGLTLDRAQGMAERLHETHVVTYTESGLWLHLGLRLDHKVLRDVRVRRAISMAIDRRSLADVAYGGHAVPANGCFPPRHVAHQPDLEPIRYDVAFARALLAEALLGSKGGGSGSAEPLSLRLQFGTGSQSSERVASMIQAALAAIGIEVFLEGIPVDVLFGRMKERSHAELVLSAWRSGPDWNARSILRSDGRQNFSGLSDPEMDRLLDRAETEQDAGRWAAVLREVERRYRTLLPSVPLLFRQAVSVRPRRLVGWRPTGTTTPVTWNAEEWHFSP